MVLYIIGTGLFGYKSITIDGIGKLKMCGHIYIHNLNKSLYNNYISKGYEVKVLSTEDINCSESHFYDTCRNGTVAFLVEGDFTYKNFYFSAIKGIASNHPTFNVKIIHNSSLFNAVGCSGLQLYRFGRSFEIRHLLATESFEIILENILINVKRKLHTFIHYDAIDAVSSKSTTNFFENLLKSAEDKKNSYLSEISPCIALSVSDNNKIRVDKFTLKGLVDYNNKLSWFGFVILSDLHPVEEEALTKLVSIWQTPQRDLRHTFHLIGIGLGYPSDITLSGKAALDTSEKVYLEGYTSVMMGGETGLMQIYYDKEIEVADREITEERSHEIIDHLHNGDVSFLVVGDPLGATTHADLLIRVIDAKFNVNIINNASIISAASVSGLLPEDFGEIVSIPFWEDGWRPESFYDKICNNFENDLHTLCLLDIKVKEVSLENLAKGKKHFEPPRFMTASHAAGQLLQIIIDRVEPTILNDNTKMIALVQIGTASEKIKECDLRTMSTIELFGQLHSLIIVRQ